MSSLNILSPFSIRNWARSNCKTKGKNGHHINHINDMSYRNPGSNKIGRNSEKTSEWDTKYLKWFSQKNNLQEYFGNIF